MPGFGTTAVRAESVVVTTAANGTGTFYVGPVNGRLRRVTYAAGADPLGAAAVITCTDEETGATLLLISPLGTDVRWQPLRIPVKAEDGTPLAGGVPAQDECRKFQPIADSRIKIVIDLGGATKSGTLRFEID